MPENMKRKITVEPSSTKSKDAQRRPSVFERLGTKASTSSSSAPVSSNNEGSCRNWAQSGTCPYGKSCKYASTHTLISPSKQRAAKKDVETKQKPSHPSTTPKPNIVVSKEDLNKRLHSTVVVKKTHTGASPDLNWENWDQTDLEYEDEKVLEKRRQLLQRELELQMKREKEEQQKKKKVKKVKKGMSSSSSTSASSSSSTESSSSSDDSSSTSSSTSGDSRKKKTKPKTPKRDSSSSTSETDQATKKKTSKTRKSDSIPPANKKTPPARKDDRSSSSKRKESPTNKKNLAGSSKQSQLTGKKRSATPPGRNRHRSQSPGSKDRVGGSSRTSLPVKKSGGRHGSPLPPKRSQSVDRREKRNHSSSPRTSARDREREKEKDKDKEREREKEKDKEREKERDRGRDQGRSHSPKTKGRDRAISPRRDSQLRDPRKKGSPDSGNSKDKGVRVSPGKSRPTGNSVRPRDSSLDTKHSSAKNSPSNARDGERRESNRNDSRDMRDRISDTKKSSGENRRGDAVDKGSRAKESTSDRNNSNRSTKDDTSNRRDADAISNRDSGRRRDLPMLPGPVDKPTQDRDSKSDKDRIREPRDNSRDNRDGRDRDNLDPRLSRNSKNLRVVKEVEREKEREEALERCRERQRERERERKARERERKAREREEKAREHERELPSLLQITTHNPIKNGQSGGMEDSKGLDKAPEKGPDRNRERDRERGSDRDRGPERDRGLDRAVDRERGPDRDRTTTRGLDRAPERERGLDRGLDRGLPERERGPERDRGPERGSDRDRGLDRGSDRGRAFDRERGLDRGPDRDRGLDRSLDRDRPLERGPERDRIVDRGLADRDRGLERGPERERGIDRGPIDRDRMFDRDRGVDRTPIKGPPHDRSLDRSHDRGLNRGLPDRNFERITDRSFERDPDRVVFDRDSRDDPGYSMPPRVREDGRRPLVGDDKDYDSPYDSRRGRDDRSRYSDQLERNRYEDPAPPRDDSRRLGPDTRNFPDDRRGRGREGRGSLEPMPWDGRGRGDRGDRDRDLHDRETDRRRPPYDREEPRSPVTSLKGRDWETRDYSDGRREWDGRGARRGPPPDWDTLHRGEWIEKDVPPLDSDWDMYGPGGPGDWPPGRERWGDEWDRPVRALPRLPPRLPLHPPEYHHPEELPLAPIESKELLVDVGLNGDKPCLKEEESVSKKPDVAEAPSLKRPRESDAEVDKPEPKKSCADETVPLEPEDLSDISDDDADEILNREDIELASTVTVQVQQHQSPNVPPQSVTSNDTPKKDGEKEKDVDGNEKISAPPNADINRDSTDPHSLLQQDDETTLDQLDFEEISDEELEEEARAGLGDALGVDWASLVAESRPRVRSEVQPGSARRRWEGLHMLARLGVSAKYAGQDLMDELSAKLKTIQQEDKENDDSAPTDDGEFAFLHPVALIHVALREKQARRKALFASAGPYKRALSARRDLFIRRQLCNLPVNEVSVENQGQNTDEIYRLAIQLFEKD